MRIKYGFGKAIDLDFDSAVKTVTEALQTEGFGVLTDIDVQATLKKKLGEEIHSYRILGACNPSLAHQALMNEHSIGLLLPCNVIVREEGDGTVYIEFMDPEAVLNLVDNPEVNALAAEVSQRLHRVLQAL